MHRWRWRSAAAAWWLLAPLFTALLNYRHIGAGRKSEEGRRAWEGIEFLGGEERTNYPVGLSVEDFGEELGLTAQVCAPVSANAVCELMERALEELVEALESAPTTPLSRLDVLPPDARRRLLVEWNQTEVEYPKEQSIHELFEAQARLQPEAIAVEYEQTAVSYGELNAQANRLARYLRRLGVKPDERVGLCVERSVEMLLGILGVLKAGGAYVPLDPSYPRDRIAYMLEDSRPVVVLTQGREVRQGEGSWKRRRKRRV